MIKPKKSLGQNFLTDKNILKKISVAINATSNDFVLEIGPGTGALTEFIIKSKPKKFVAVDVDERSIELLNEKYSISDYPFLEIIHSDIRKINFQELVSSAECREVIVAGNIPYNISADIFFWVFSNRNIIDKVILMIQKEVAQRINSKKGTKTYGILSVVLNYIGKSKILFDVSPHCFYPKPKVTSSVIELKFDKKVSDSDFKEFVALVKACFGQRRKVLKNSLSTYLSDNNINSGELNSVILNKYFSKRAEELGVEDFVVMMNELRRLKEDLKIKNEE